MIQEKQFDFRKVLYDDTNLINQTCASQGNWSPVPGTVKLDMSPNDKRSDSLAAKTLPKTNTSNNKSIDNSKYNQKTTIK